MSFTVSGGLGEAETGGPVLNIVPRDRRQQRIRQLLRGVGPQWLQGSNYTEELKAAGLTAATPLIKIYDYNGAVGGPIQQDRLWFFLTARTQGNAQYMSNMYVNQNAGNPNAWTYVPDSAGKPSAIGRGRTPISG